MFCKYCGKAVPEGARFCGCCGKKLDEIDNVVPKVNEEVIEIHKVTSAKTNGSWMKWAGFAAVVVFGIAGYCFWGSSGENETVHKRSSTTFSNSNIKLNNTNKTATSTTRADTKPVAKKSYSTKVRPKIEEFNWTATVMKNGVWKNAKKVTAFKDISGTWKCLNTYDPTRKMGKYCRDISNVTISGTEGNAKVLYDWYKIFYEGEPPEDMTKGPKTTMTGAYKKGTTGKWELTVSTKGSKLVMDQFYVYNGKQYAIGVIMLADGTVGDVTMVRP